MAETTQKMHADELHIDEHLVRRLVRDQLPQWAELPVVRVESTGTVNALYRLGDDMVVRLPRRYAGDIDREHATVTLLVGRLPVAIPEPLGRGEPAKGYPFQWCVDRWVEGEHPVAGELVDPDLLAHDLADLVRELWKVDPSGAPPVGRGTSLARWDAPARKGLAQLEDLIDTRAAAAAWEISVAQPDWSDPPVWVHGDLIPFNLLMRGDRLSAVLDWAGAGLGDPATDLQPAWNLLPASARRIFRSELDVDEATWLRGRGWALWTGLVGLPYYKDTNPVFARNSLHRIRAVLEDFGS